MNGVQESNLQQFAAQYIINNTQSLIKTVEKSKKRKDIEDIHDIRVATRRIRTGLDVFGNFFPKKKVNGWEKVIRKITKSFGSTRDLDVQIEFLNSVLPKIKDPKLRSGIKRLKLRISQKRLNKEKQVSDLTDSILDHNTIDELHQFMKDIAGEEEIKVYSNDVFKLAFTIIHQFLDGLIFYEVYIHHPEKIDELHLMRIAAKKLRYTIEIFAPLYEGKIEPFLNICKTLQEILGKIRDYDVWLMFLPKFLKEESHRIQKFYGYKSSYYRVKPGIEYLINHISKARKKKYQDFINLWKKWRSDETWLILRELILEYTLKEPEDKQSISPEIPTSDSTKDN